MTLEGTHHAEIGVSARKRARGSEAQLWRLKHILVVLRRCPSMVDVSSMSVVIVVLLVAELLD